MKTLKEYLAEIHELEKERDAIQRKINFRQNKVRKIKAKQDEDEWATINTDDINSITIEQWKYILHHYHGESMQRYQHSTKLFNKLKVSMDGIAGGKYHQEVRQFQWAFHDHYDFKNMKDLYYRVKDALNFHKSEADETEDIWTIRLYVNIFETRWSNYNYYIEIRKSDNKARIIDLSSYARYSRVKTRWITLDEMEELINKYKGYEPEEDDCYCEC